jgi:nitrite reductase (NO-forming)
MAATVPAPAQQAADSSDGITQPHSTLVREIEQFLYPGDIEEAVEARAAIRRRVSGYDVEQFFQRPSLRMVKETSTIEQGTAVSGAAQVAGSGVPTWVWVTSLIWIVCIASLGAAVAIVHNGDPRPPALPERAPMPAMQVQSSTADPVTTSSAPPAVGTKISAELPAVTAGPAASFEIVAREEVVELANGVHYKAWTFNGHAVGPALHVREGQKVTIRFVNKTSMPHSLDFHAARVAPNRAFADVKPGKSITYSFIASDPGVYLYHCVTMPGMAHIANGMHGAIVVDPKQALPKADKEYVLDSSEWYLNSDGKNTPAALDYSAARQLKPTLATFNGQSKQYEQSPLTAKPNDLVRFYIANAGPNLPVAFHVVGAVFDRVYPDGSVASPITKVQTAMVAPGGGAIFEVRAGEAGYYPFVNHSFAAVDMGQVGVLKVGNPAGPEMQH